MPSIRRSWRQPLAASALSQSAQALGDHQDPGVAVARRDRGHDARVGDAQPCDAVHAQLGIDDREVVVPIRHEPAWWWYESAVARRNARSSSSVCGSSAGMQLLAGPGRERLRREDLARDLDRLDHLVQVGLRVAEVVRVRPADGPIGSALASLTVPRDFGRTTPGQDADRVRVALPDDDVERHVDERDLQVRPGLGRIRACRNSALSDRFWCPAGTGCGDSWMTPVSTWLWKFRRRPGRSHHRLDADGFQLGRVADAGQQQQLGRLDRAGRRR